jgi:hypothetical protein
VLRTGKGPRWRSNGVFLDVWKENERGGREVKRGGLGMSMDGDVKAWSIGRAIWVCIGH